MQLLIKNTSRLKCYGGVTLQHDDDININDDTTSGGVVPTIGSRAHIVLITYDKCIRVQQTGRGNENY